MHKQTNSPNNGQGKDNNSGQKNSIKIEDVLKEVELQKENIDTKRKKLKKDKVPKILVELLNQIEPINFREYCEFENEKDNLKKNIIWLPVLKAY